MCKYLLNVVKRNNKIERKRKKKQKEKKKQTHRKEKKRKHPPLSHKDGQHVNPKGSFINDVMQK